MLTVETTLTVEEAIEVIWGEINTGRAATASAAVDLLWPLALSEEAVDSALRVGLIFLAGKEPSVRRGTDRPPIAWGSPHGKAWAPYLQTFATQYEGADGCIRRLIDFSTEDLQAFESLCQKRSAGWADRYEIAKRTREQMQHYGAATVGDLPSSELETLAEAWTEVWA
jgi:hypothetical protein